jgi:type II restriction enzyme
MEYISKSQIARVETEKWAINNLFCPFCGHPMSESSANTKVFDFSCTICNQQYQLKTLSKRIGKKLIGSEYYTFIKAVETGTVPNFIIMEYFIEDNVFMAKEVIFIPKVFITEETIEKRKPLSETARRAGWTGCNLLFEQIPSYGKLKIVANQEFLPKDSILLEVKKIANLYNLDSQKSRWKIEMLKIIDQLNKEFILQDVYNYSLSLERLFPDNNHIRDKIRLTSSVLCQQEDRVYSLAYVLIHEYRIEDSFYACSVGKDPHGSCPPPYLPKSPFDGVGCPYCLAEIRISELEAGEQIIKIIL